MEAREHSHFALPNSNLSFSDLLIMCKIIGLLHSLGSGNCVVTRSSRKWLSEWGHLSSCTPLWQQPWAGGSHSPSATHAVARPASHGTYKEAVPLTKVSNHMCNTIIFSWPQLICFSPSIHKTQRQWVWLSLHGNAGPTQVLSLFFNHQNKICFLQFWLLFALCNRRLIKLPSQLPHCVRTASLFRVLFSSLTYLLPKRH